MAQAARATADPRRTDGVDIQVRRNSAEILVRDRLAEVEDVYVDRSSWHRVGDQLEPFVAVIARHELARRAARAALEDVAGLSEQEWSTSWIPLNLGDFMIRVYPSSVV